MKDILFFILFSEYEIPTKISLAVKIWKSWDCIAPSYTYKTFYLIQKDSVCDILMIQFKAKTADFC